MPRSVLTVFSSSSTMHAGLNCADEGDSYFIPARYVEWGYLL